MVYYLLVVLNQLQCNDITNVLVIGHKLADSDADVKCHLLFVPEWFHVSPFKFEKNQTIFEYHKL